MALSLGRTNRLLLLFGALSLAAVSLGAWICARHGVPAALWSRNLAAWAVGALLAMGISRAGPAILTAVLLGAAAALAGALLGEGQLGVRRWIDVGPLNVNVALLMLPAALVALASLGRRHRWPWALALSALTILVIQPDASQASAWGAGLAWLAIRAAPGGRAAGVGILLATAALVAASWFRPDPLEPIPEVEHILHLGHQLSPMIAAAGLALLLMTALTPGLLTRDGGAQAEAAGGALALYFLVSAAMPFAGAFPVPLMGVGISPVLGAWLGAGALAATLRTGPT